MSRATDTDEKLHALHTWYGHGVLFGITRAAVDRAEQGAISKAMAYNQYRLGARHGAAIRKESPEIQQQEELQQG